MLMLTDAALIRAYLLKFLQWFFFDKKIVFCLDFFENWPPDCQGEREEDWNVVDGHREVYVEKHEERPKHWELEWNLYEKNLLLN